MIDIPIMDVPLSCITKAESAFHVPLLGIISVLLTEGGHVGQISRNSNGSYDLGPMQVNSSWLQALKKRHISRDDILYNHDCANIYVGTWILAKKIANSNNILVGFGDYNSHTTSLNKAYYEKVRVNYTKLKIVLS